MDPEAAKAQVRAQVAAVLEDRKVGDVAYFLGQLLDLAVPGLAAHQGRRGRPRSSCSSMRRAVIKRFLEADAARGARREGPLVLVFDDLHWAHDDSLDLLAVPRREPPRADPPRCASRARRCSSRRATAGRATAASATRVIELSPLGDDRRRGGHAGPPGAVRRRPRRSRTSSTRRARSPAATRRSSSRWSASTTTPASSR